MENTILGSLEKFPLSSCRTFGAEAMTCTSDYPFNDEWKAKVDHNGQEWMHYCEAVELVKRFIRTRRQCGHEASIQEILNTCKIYRSQGEERVTRLKKNFRLIWKHEKAVLIQEVMS